ncbi:MAG: hypothetical protein HYR84_02955 [Planctomycetes bacterium]|nr:hypothetical protein [Planctomycetota bacterium]
MNMLKGTIQDGQVVLPQPANLPDGTPVTVLTHEHSGSLGIPDDEWPTDPDGIAQLLARMDRVEPFDMTLEEEAEIEAWRQKVKEYTLANQDRRIEGLFE